MEGRPFEETSLIQEKTDNDDRYKRPSSIPHNVPDDGNIANMDDAGKKRDYGPGSSTPADSKPAGLPNYENESGEKD